MSLIETEFEREARLRAPRGRNYVDPDDIITSPSTSAHVDRYPHTRNSAMFEGGDIASAALASLMMLAPLAAYAVGWGA